MRDTGSEKRKEEAVQEAAGGRRVSCHSNHLGLLGEIHFSSGMTSFGDNCKGFFEMYNLNQEQKSLAILKTRQFCNVLRIFLHAEKNMT